MLVVEDVANDPRLGGVADAASEAGIEAVIAVPLLAQGDVIGLLGVFPARGRVLTENESALLSALAAQLAVAVQNAQLHEHAKLLGEEREQALQAERAASRQVRALYEISRSFAQSLSLEATLDALASTVVDVLDVDIALIGLPDDRREWLVPRALKIAEPRVEESARSILTHPWPFGAHPLQRLFRRYEQFLAGREAFRRQRRALLPHITLRIGNATFQLWEIFRRDQPGGGRGRLRPKGPLDRRRHAQRLSAQRVRRHAGARPF